MSNTNSPNQDKSLEVEFFDNWARSKTYIEHGHFTTSGHTAIIKAFQKLIKENISPRTWAVDLGCGPGAFTRHFSEFFQINCVGVDISFGLLKAAKDQGGELAKYVLADVENLSLKDECFDVVIFSGVMHHFPNKQPSLRQAYKILKKGGCVIAYDPNIKNPFMWFYKEFSSTLFSKKGQTENEKLFEQSEIKSEMEKAGFNNVRVNAISGVHFKYVGSTVGMLLLPFYNFIETILGMLPISKTHGSFLITYAQK